MATSVRASIHQCTCSVIRTRLTAARSTSATVLAIAGIALFAVSVCAAGPISAGDDAWVTPCGGGAYIDFSSTPIPAGFFDGISEPFGGTLELGGDALVPPQITPAPASDVDTIVHRNATLATFMCGSTETVDIEIVALSLISCTPITVRSSQACAGNADCPAGWLCGAGSTCESTWEVQLCLAPGPQLLGSMTIRHVCPEGGTYSSSLPVNVQLTFTRTDGAGSAGPLLKSDTFDSAGWWSHDGSALSLTSLENGTDFFDCNGNLHTSENPLPPDFFPGVYLPNCVGCAATAGNSGTGDDCCTSVPGQTGCSDPGCAKCVCSFFPSCCEPGGWGPKCAADACELCQDFCPCCLGGPGPTKPKLNPEQARLAAHGVAIANLRKLSGGHGGTVLTQACCKPVTSANLPCIDVDPNDCTTMFGGTPLGPNTNCANTDCGNPIYENWVIADDFCVICPKCSCDVNGDGICNIADLQNVTDCINGLAGAPPTSVADLNCNGYCDQGDYDIVQCLIQGFSPDMCCGPDAVVGPTIDRVEWFGSYLDPDFDPKITIPPREPDGWLIALHSNIPAEACPLKDDPTLTPIDWCGTLIAGVEDPCILFNPKGSAFNYLILNNAALGTAVVGDMIRICGHIDPNAISTCLQGIAGIFVQSVLECGTEVSRPDRLITQWAIPDPDLVDRANIGKVGWDLHPIYRYGANLRDACVMHDHRSTAEIGPNGAFLPIPDRTYWISIQAEVGHLIIKNADGSCSETLSGQIADRDFFGWHTTPPGYQRKDDAYMGQLLMGNPETPCVDDWFYDWMGPLHCSDPRFRDCCDDPTKSIDMAFYLMGPRTGLCADGVTPCTVDADCGPFGPCIGAGRVVHWCQPVNPGPPSDTDPPPPERPTPEGGVDELSQTTAVLVGNLGDLPFNVEVRGPTVIRRTSEVSGVEPIPFHIQTEIISMELTGGGVTLRLDPLVPSLGTIQRTESFFDVFFEINVEVEGIPGQPLVRARNVGMQARVHELPPSDVVLSGPVKGPVPLLDNQGIQVGVLKTVTHFIPYKGGVNIHSDADWASVPTTDCCEPDPSTTTGCTKTLCPIDTEICLPFCVAPNVNGILEVNECDCIDPKKTCYADVEPLNGGVVCKGSCPPGQVCDGPNFVDTNADGIADAWKCGCIDEPTGACCIIVAGATPTCVNNVTATHCVSKGGSFHPGASCLGVEACCDNVTGTCQDIDALCCADIAGATSLGAGSMCFGLLQACCDPNTSTCTMEDPVCCSDHGGTPLIGLVCSGTEACCDPNTLLCTMEEPACCEAFAGVSLSGLVCSGALEACCDPNTGTCTMKDPLCCEPFGGIPLPGLVCAGTIEACCDPTTGLCTMEDPTCCSTHGTSQGPSSDCAIPGTCGGGVCELPIDQVPVCAAIQDTACISDDPNARCLPLSVVVSGGVVVTDDCQCLIPDGLCGPVNVIGDPANPTLSCEKNCPDPANQNCWVHLDGVAQIGVISLLASELVAFPNVRVSCGCVTKERGACCENSSCIDGVTQVECDALFGLFFLNQICLGVEACCLPDDTCQELDRLCCQDIVGATPLGPGTFCSGSIEACCDNNTGACTMEDRTCCATHGVPQGFMSDCATPGICGGGICELPPDQVPVCQEVQAFACISDDPNTLCLPNSVIVDDNGFPFTEECKCLIPDGLCGPVNVIPDLEGPIISCEKACPIPGQICLIHQSGVATKFSSLPGWQLVPGERITCDCVDQPCEPNADGSACVGVCPGGKACQPQLIEQCATPPCRIIECGCEQPGDDCHIELPPPGTTVPTCAGTCPPSVLPRKCVKRLVDSNGDLIKDAWQCRCVKKWATPVLSDPTAPKSGRTLNGIVVPAPDGGVGASESLPSSSSTLLLQAIKVTFDSLHHPDPPQDDPCPPPLPGDLCISPDFGAFEGNSMWLGAVHEFNLIQFPPTFFKAATLHCDPKFFDFAAEGAISVYAAGIISDSAYSLRVYDLDCADSLDEPECASDPLIVTTGRWGDVEEVFQGPDTAPQPNVIDIKGIVDNLKGIPGAPDKTLAQLHDNTPDPTEHVNVLDLQNAVDAVKFFRYPWSGPCPCPPEVTCVFVNACKMDTDCPKGRICVGGFCTCQTNADCGIMSTCWHGFCTSATDQCDRCALP